MAHMAARFALLLALQATVISGWIDELSGAGWTIQQGQYGFFDMPTCFHSDTCYAINPLTPYGLMWLPPHPNETSNGNYSNTCHLHDLCREVNGTTYSPSWRMGEGEVIVLEGQTPPRSTYWSFSNYLYTRYHQPGWHSNASLSRRLVGCRATPEGGRCEVFSGVNDPLNMQTVQLDGERGDPFEAPLQLLLTFDAKSERLVSEQMQQSRDGNATVNTLRFPGAILHQGVSNGTEDEFLNVLRLEGVVNQSKRDAFYNNNQLKVYRLTPPPDFSVARVEKFDTFDGRMRTRWTGTSENVPGAATNAQLRAGLHRLKQAVVSRHRQLLDYVEVPFTSFVNDSGYECISDGSRCQGDCRDTIYARAELIGQELFCNVSHLPCKPSRDAELSADPTDAIYIVGVNHRMTNQSLYSSLTAYNYPKLASGRLVAPDGTRTYTVMESAQNLSGSAAAYIPSDDPAAPFLYVVKVARSCEPRSSIQGSELCYEMVTDGQGQEVVIGLNQPVVFIERMYVHPKTKSGPAVAETVLPELIHFRQRRFDFVRPL